MVASDHDRASELFHEVVDLDPSLRSIVFEERCRSAPDLRAEVESLLRHDELPPALLQTGEPALLRPEGRLPSHIGAYEVVGLLGEGGMGVVYRAVKPGPRGKRVAVKVLGPGLQWTPAVEWFEAEMHVLGCLRHPNVARLYDGGTTDDGRPFFAMELVEGGPFTRYCDRRRLELRQRLELFRRVCSGVQHAHDRGILHLDLKPSNVLIGEPRGVPIPKIIDFGLSSARASPELKLGTREYMSPEHVRGGIGQGSERSDIYALGVMLYEVVTGLRPSGRVRSSGHSAIDAIVRRALSHEPQRRHACPAELASDVRRWL